MIKMTEEVYKNYYNDIKNLMHYFFNDANREDEVLHDLRKFINDGSAFASGHIIENKLVSFIWCYPRKYSGQERLHISYFIVDEEFRGKGLSKDLLKFANRTANELGIDIIDLNVDEMNEKAIRVYKRAGFVVEKIQLKKHLSEE